MANPLSTLFTCHSLCLLKLHQKLWKYFLKYYTWNRKGQPAVTEITKALLDIWSAYAGMRTRWCSAARCRFIRPTNHLSWIWLKPKMSAYSHMDMQREQRADKYRHNWQCIWMDHFVYHTCELTMDTEYKALRSTLIVIYSVNVCLRQESKRDVNLTFRRFGILMHTCEKGEKNDNVGELMCVEDKARENEGMQWFLILSPSSPFHQVFCVYLRMCVWCSVTTLWCVDIEPLKELRSRMRVSTNSLTGLSVRWTLFGFFSFNKISHFLSDQIFLHGIFLWYRISLISVYFNNPSQMLRIITCSYLFLRIPFWWLWSSSS